MGRESFRKVRAAEIVSCRSQSRSGFVSRHWQPAGSLAQSIHAATNVPSLPRVAVPPWAWKTDGALVGHLGCLMNGRRRGGDPRAGGDRATVRQAPPCSFAYASFRMPVTRCCDRPLRPASTTRGYGSGKEGHAVVPPSIIVVGAPDAYTPSLQFICGFT